MVVVVASIVTLMVIIDDVGGRSLVYIRVSWGDIGGKDSNEESAMAYL